MKILENVAKGRERLGKVGNCRKRHEIVGKGKNMFENARKYIKQIEKIRKGR